MITCKSILDSLSDYIDDSVAAEVRKELESHIAECSSCQVIIDTSRRTLKVVTDVGSFEIPSDVSERLLQKTLASLGGPIAKGRGPGTGDPGAGDPSN